MTHTHPRSLLPLAALGWLTAALAGQGNPSHSCTWLGGSFNGNFQDQVLALAVAQNGDLVVAGRTDSTDFPVTAGAFDTQLSGQEDAFIARLSPDCSQVLAATYFGGRSFDRAVFVKVAGDGSIWVGGSTQSPDYPTTPDAFMTHSGNTDAFVARLDANLTTLHYSTAFGCNGPSAAASIDSGDGFAIDEANQLVYIAGITDRDWSLLPGAVQTTLRGGSDYYLATLDLSQQGSTTLAFATLLGGSSRERNPGSLTLEGNGVVTWSGGTQSVDFPTTAGAFQTTNPSAGTSNVTGIVARIDTSPQATTRFVYGSYIGGSGVEHAHHATDPSGVVHVLLNSTSGDLRLTPNAMITTRGVNDDAYYAQLDPARTGAAQLRYGSWILTNGSEAGGDIAFANGKIAFFLRTSGFGQPTSPGAFMASSLGNIVGFVMELDVTSRPDPFVTYASCYGAGRNNTIPTVMLYDGTEVVLGGHGDGFAAPVTPTAFQLQNAGSQDGFVGRLELRPWPASFTSFGTACAGSAGTPQLRGTSAARLAHRLVLTASGLPSGGSGFFMIGFDNRQLGGLTLPLSLGQFGAPGCELVVAPVVIQTRRATGSGEATIDLRTPIDPLMLEHFLFAQYGQLDAAANSLGLVTSNGLAAEIRW